MASKLTVWTRFAAIDQTTSVAKRIGASVSSIGRSASRVTSMLRVAAAGLVTGAAGKAIASFAARADDIGDVAKRIGLSAVALQELQYAAAAADLSAEDLTSVLQKMNNNLGQLRAGTGTLYSNLVKTNPVLARQLRTVEDSEEAFTLLMDSIAKETNVQKRAALAQAAFGKSGQEVIDMADTLAEKRKEARESGTLISEADQKAGAALHATLLRLKASGMGLLNGVLGRLAQVIGPLLEKWSAWVIANRELINQKIDAVVRGIGRAWEFLKPFLDAAVKAFTWLKPALPYIVAGIIGLTAAQWALNVAMDANPIGAVILALEALVVAVIVVIRYWDEITAALAVGWKKVNDIFNAPGVRIALAMIAQPLLLILSTIQTIIDLVSGKGWKSFLNLAGPWKSLTDAIGLTKKGGELPISPNAPAAAGAQSLSWAGTLDIAGAPKGSRVTSEGSGAPAITINRGMGIAGGGR